MHGRPAIRAGSHIVSPGGKVTRFKDNSSTAWEELDGGDRSEFSLARYEPMARLFSEEDLRFVEAQPGYTPEMGREFRRERRRIFRSYLRELAGDFNRLHTRARAIAASLPAEHSALVGSLMRLQCRFWYEMAVLRLSLSLGWMGMRTIHVGGLVHAVVSMQAEVSRLSAPALA